MSFTAAHAVPLAFDTAPPADADLADCRPERRAPLALRGTHELALALRHAGTRRVRIAWELQGPVDAPLLIVQGGISAHRHVAASARFAEPGWWDVQCGPNRALDTTRVRVLAIDWLGADGTLDCCIDPADQADAIAAVLDALGVARAVAYIGASYGAMVGLQFASRHPTRLQRLIAISGAHRSHPQVTALRVVQRRIVALGRSEGGAREALALARALAVIGYRSAEEFGTRFDATPSVDADTSRFPIEDYFDAIGPRFVARFSSTAYTRLSESIDLQYVDPATVRVPTELVAVLQDQVVPTGDIDTLAATIAATSRVHRVDSPYGHDAFLKEPAAIERILRGALARELAA